MRDFKDFKGDGKGKESVGGTDFVYKMAEKFNGRSPAELYGAVIEEAKKRKKAGTLSNQEIDSFYSALAPILDDEKKKMLQKVIEKLKKI